MSYRKTIAIAFLIGCFGASVEAAETTAESIMGERLQALERYWNAGDATGLVDNLYAQDILIAGEELTDPADGRAEAKPLVQSLITAFPEAHLAIERIIPSENGPIGTWVLWTLPSKDKPSAPTTVRSLFLWTKENGAWVIKADMYSFGKY
ncbi:nuclear transport factor 2 family protein [Sinorhizobium alkalisoli]|uniref:nuclear transport factor 2 family protein n=1 Tax=Sinorhizobium alkalisoli TaxID=1752398 RepID=UPI00124BD6EC|nr:nuclear transport factor 2 family protein [Sinorhizobium alkalisoli]QFI69737.1 hypothetical protein EKH55_4863 [Sinorhizobium alkalisoli]